MATTFYHQISANKRQSFLLAIVVAGILGLLGFVIGYALTGTPEGGLGATLIAVAIAGLTSIGSYMAGDKLVLATSKAIPVDEQTAPQLINVVREMSIAAGVPMPRVYVIEDTAPNAFATGRDPEHASVAVTTGLLEKMDREELQGVLGHELSHVRNYDIRFTLLVGVLVGGVALLSDFFLRWTFWFGGGSRSDRDRGGGGGGLQVVFFILAIVLAIVAPIAAQLVRLAVNRQREFLADASSVELTRNPHGLERALEKIATDKEVLEVASGATQHMYFTNPIKKFEARARGLFSTHPPIVERVNRLRELTGEQPLDPNEAAVLSGLD
ncbi:MAG TPA: M48 family metalloprotease [Candidatus Limnocylindria bacterium]|nr:M48 family metalloprotease [Candidatus Limnocylindria bacterium]